MAEVVANGELGASVDEVWGLVGDFGAFIEAMGFPAELEGEGVGMTRTIPAGEPPTIERLDVLDEANHVVQYTILQSGLGTKDAVGRIELTPIGDERTAIRWSSTFTVQDGIDEGETGTFIQSIYAGTIGFLQSKFGS